MLVRLNRFKGEITGSLDLAYFLTVFWDFNEKLMGNCSENAYRDWSLT